MKLGSQASNLPLEHVSLYTVGAARVLLSPLTGDQLNGLHLEDLDLLEKDVLGIGVFLVVENGGLDGVGAGLEVAFGAEDDGIFTGGNEGVEVGDVVGEVLGILILDDVLEG